MQCATNGNDVNSNRQTRTYADKLEMTNCIIILQCALCAAPGVHVNTALVMLLTGNSSAATC
eukprot:12283-Heterococcus_DN1.PRE.1